MQVLGIVIVVVEFGLHIMKANVDNLSHSYVVSQIPDVGGSIDREIGFRHIIVDCAIIKLFPVR